MKTLSVDLVIVGAGPVGLMCAYLAHLSGLSVFIADHSTGPLTTGRADALNARTLQLFEIVDLFDDLYPLGKTCNTSSVWENGKFTSRQSSWWTQLEGCFHKHFLMIGQSHVEQLLVRKLGDRGIKVWRGTSIEDVQVLNDGCLSTTSAGGAIHSKYVIGADGAHSLVRNLFQVGFDLVRPEIIWAVIDGEIETDFPKVPEIIVFQNESSDVAWIPREGALDRFYVRMDRNDFSFEEALEKINRAIRPHRLSFREISWFSKFSVKEGVAETFLVNDRVFLAGDACHVHSVNGGQGLNTGIADAFNLIWKLNMVLNFGASKDILSTYEAERKPVAHSVIESSGELVRSTKHSATGTHAQDYVRIVEKRSGNITGMGIRYGESGLVGSRVFDMELIHGAKISRLYSLLDYATYTLLIFDGNDVECEVPPFVKVIRINSNEHAQGYRTTNLSFSNQAVLVRPDSYIASVIPLSKLGSLNYETSDYNRASFVFWNGVPNFHQ